MAGRTQVSKVAHRVENALEVVRAKNRSLLPTEARVLIEVVDLLHPLIEGIEGGEPVWEALYDSLAGLERVLGVATSAAQPSSERLPVAQSPAVEKPRSDRESPAPAAFSDAAATSDPGFLSPRPASSPGSNALRPRMRMGDPVTATRRSTMVPRN